MIILFCSFDWDTILDSLSLTLFALTVVRVKEPRGGDTQYCDKTKHFTCSRRVGPVSVWCDQPKPPLHPCPPKCDMVRLARRSRPYTRLAAEMAYCPTTAMSATSRLPEAAPADDSSSRGMNVAHSSSASVSVSADVAGDLSRREDADRDLTRCWLGVLCRVWLLATRLRSVCNMWQAGVYICVPTTSRIQG